MPKSNHVETIGQTIRAQILAGCKQYLRGCWW